ncbi:hypothetical protein F5B21DRAFT_251318 [Xylaria acuta]|nr:hypothetical protein F5B21DRAFT_251318 [Xylaria acuta]
MSEPQAINADSPPAGFPQFTRLPTELRLIVWEMAMDEPRTICILGFPADRTPRTLVDGGDKFIDAPGFFFVNRECRKVATKAYTNLTVMMVAIDRTIRLNLKAKRGDDLAFWCTHDECAGWRGTLVDALAARSVYPPHNPFTLSRIPNCPVDDVRRWVLSLQSDGCISEHDTELWCDLQPDMVPRITIIIYHPYLDFLWASSL